MGMLRIPSSSLPLSILSKGEQTRRMLLDAALRIAGREGLEGITIGGLAEAVQMSKSGVFAHFGSREDLQLAVCGHYHEAFREKVFSNALQQPRGMPRLQKMYANWLDLVEHEIMQGCIYISGAFEYADRPGPVQTALRGLVSTWRRALTRAVNQAAECGHLVMADAEGEQIVFELYSAVLGFHHDMRFLQRTDAKVRALHAFHRIVLEPVPASSQCLTPVCHVSRA